MTLIRLTAAILLIGLAAACGTTQTATAQNGGSPMIDVPTPPFPYNSRWW